MEKKNLGAFLASLRREKGWTQKEVAELLHVSDKTVSRWERDESVPDLFLVPDIAQLYGITSDEVICGAKKEREAGAYGYSDTKSVSGESGYREKLWMRYQARFLIDSGLMCVNWLALVVLESMRSYHKMTLHILHGIGFGISLFVVASQIFHIERLLEELMEIVRTDVKWREFCKKVIYRGEGVICAAVCAIAGIVGKTVEMANGDWSVMDPFLEGAILSGVMCIFIVPYVNYCLKKRRFLPDWEDEKKRIKSGENTK